eukprot:2100597-Amphidinium_carterae.1
MIILVNLGYNSMKRTLWPRSTTALESVNLARMFLHPLRAPFQALSSSSTLLTKTVMVVPLYILGLFKAWAEQMQWNDLPSRVMDVYKHLHARCQTPSLHPSVPAFSFVRQFLLSEYCEGLSEDFCRAIHPRAHPLRSRRSLKRSATFLLERMCNPEAGVVMVPNINLDDLQVIPEVEPDVLQSPQGDDNRDFASLMDSASALDHYEEVNTLLEEAVFDSWRIAGQDRPASWQDGFTNLLQELNARLVDDEISYPMSQGDLLTNPYELVTKIIDKANNISIDDFLWSLQDDRCHTTNPDAWGRMDHLRRADADARGLTPTI